MTRETLSHEARTGRTDEEEPFQASEPGAKGTLEVASLALDCPSDLDAERPGRFESNSQCVQNRNIQTRLLNGSAP